MGLQTSRNIHSKSGNNSDAWQHKHKRFSRRWTQTKSNDQLILLGQLNLESPTEIHFWIAPKIPRTRLAKDLVDKICPILQYLVEHVTCMYLTPSLYVKTKGSTRSETTQPNWNGGFSCCKEPEVELHLPPRIPPLQPPPRRKGRRGVPPGARPFGPKMGTPGVAVGSMEKLR